jgi:hypothetical protein
MVKDNCLHFGGSLLDKHEYLNEADSFEYYNASGQRQTFILQPGSMGFTFCQIPVVYKHAEKTNVQVLFYDGHSYRTGENRLPSEITDKIFKRTGEIERIEVALTDN